MNFIVEFFKEVSEGFWNPGTIGLLLGTGFLLTVLTRGFQFRKLIFGLKLVFKGALHKDKSEEGKGDITPFQALTTAIASAVGNGNIAGVATAIFTGGPGAVFWMWITALVGMATSYAEGVLAVHYRHTAEDGSMIGGPMFYIRDGFQKIKFLKPVAKYLAAFFAFCGAWTALFGTGNMMQSNSIALAWSTGVNVIFTEVTIPPWITGIVLSILTAIVIIGGIKKIGKVTEKLVTVMILFYVGGALIVLAMNLPGIPGAFMYIVKSAFSPQAAVGGFVGHSVIQALRWGVRRGLLSNEAGLGSTPIAHGAARTKSPVKQGTIAMMGTFIDTLVVCTMTALVIIVTKAYMIEDPLMPGQTLNSSALTAAAFETTLPRFGGFIVSMGSALFGYSTLVGWYYYGEKCFQYLFGLRRVLYYKWFYILLIFVGAVLQKENLMIVWYVGDMSNAMMAIPNLIGLVALSGVVGKLTMEYYRKKQNGS